MSAPTISTSLTPECLSAMGTPYTTLANACGQPSGPSLTNIASNTQQLLNSACSASCASSLTDFTRAANATCGEQKVFAGNNGQTAHGLISEFALISAVGCVKDTDGSYCAVSQIQTLTSAGLSSTSTNLLSNLVTYAQKNTTFACSTCARTEISTAAALTTLDAYWAGSVQAVVQGQNLICASQPPPKNSAVGLYAGSFLAFLPLFFL